MEKQTPKNGLKSAAARPRRAPLTAAEKKAEIRARLKGDGQDEIEIIPPKPLENIFDGKGEKRIAVYTRVSTDDIRQTSSFELQKNHYTDWINVHPNWRLAGVYSDEGVSGTSVEKRGGFQRMVADCEAGKIDFIITKSISRFARNTVDCVNTVRKLAALKPPVGIWFEAEGLQTLNTFGEMILTVLSSVAQGESFNKSEAMNVSLKMRFKRGAFLTPPPLGYDLDAKKKLVVNEDEANTVRLVFFMYLYGNSCSKIARELTQYGRATKLKNTRWAAGSVLGILQNERYCGDVFAWKTYTPSYLDHKKRKNRQNRPLFKKRNHHPPIVLRDDFEAVQKMIKNAKYGNKEPPPDLLVVPNGLLKGFVSVPLHWGDFTANDYKAASTGVCGGDAGLPPKLMETEAGAGDVGAGGVDTHGVEVVRSEFFHAPHKPCAAFSSKGVGFNAACVEKLGNAHFVEILFHPGKNLLAVRPCSGESPNAAEWVKEKAGRFHPRSVAGKAFLNVLFETCGWDAKTKYRANGAPRRHENHSAIVFNLREVLPVDNGKPVFPGDWEEHFGVDLRRHAREREFLPANPGGLRDIATKGLPHENPGKIKTTSPAKISREIKNLVRGMEQGKHGHEKKT